MPMRNQLPIFPTMATPKKTVTHAKITPRKFELVAPADIPGLKDDPQELADIAAAVEVAKAHPDQAVKFYDGFADGIAAGIQHNKLKRYLRKHDLTDTMHTIRRASVVYLRVN